MSLSALGQTSPELEADRKRREAEIERWENDPFTTGTVVRHKASGTTMVVTGPAPYPRQRTCAWIDHNQRYEDGFNLCELERVEARAAQPSASIE